MSKIFLVFLFCSPIVAFTQTTENSPKLVKMEEMTYDFGRIPQGRPVIHFFKLTNVSSSAITIENVQASCGCTTPEWSLEPLQPGSSTNIKVGFNAESMGKFEKSISIKMSSGANEILLIKGEVWKTPEQPAPFNTGLRMLKSKNISGNH